MPFGPTPAASSPLASLGLARWYAASEARRLPTRSTWEPWEGSHALPRWCAASEARRLPTRLEAFRVLVTYLCCAKVDQCSARAKQRSLRSGGPSPSRDSRSADLRRSLPRLLSTNRGLDSRYGCARGRD
jgi:hypothetical protein